LAPYTIHNLSFVMVVTLLPRYGYKALLYCVEFKVGERVKDRHVECVFDWNYLAIVNTSMIHQLPNRGK
jgi:hypothetical protein